MSVALLASSSEVAARPFPSARAGYGGLTPSATAPILLERYEIPPETLYVETFLNRFSDCLHRPRTGSRRESPSTHAHSAKKWNYAVADCGEPCELTSGLGCGNRRNLRSDDRRRNNLDIRGGAGSLSSSVSRCA